MASSSGDVVDNSTLDTSSNVPVVASSSGDVVDNSTLDTSSSVPVMASYSGDVVDNSTRDTSSNVNISNGNHRSSPNMEGRDRVSNATSVLQLKSDFPHWLHPKCKRFSREPMGYFLVLKVPLNHRYNDQLASRGDYFPLKSFLDVQKRKKRRICMMVDLTDAPANTFYSKQLLDDAGISYLHIPCVKESVPSRQQVKVFVNIVSKQLATHGEDAFVGVHDWYSYNLSGMMVVSYMVEECGMELRTALDMYAKVRSPGIYDEAMLNKLYEWYNDGDDMPLDDRFFGVRAPWDTKEMAPPPPKRSASKMRLEVQKRKKRKLESVSTPLLRSMSPVADAHAVILQREMQKWWSRLSEELTHTPIDLPLDAEHSAMLLKEGPSYCVTWVPSGDDGTLLCMRDGVFFCPETLLANVVTSGVYYHFPRLDIRNARHPQQRLTDSCIQATFVVDKVEGKEITRLLLWDMLLYRGQPMKFDVFKRQQAIADEILKPLKKLPSNPGLSLRAKHAFQLGSTRKVMKMVGSLPHENTGLVFSPVYTDKHARVFMWNPNNSGHISTEQLFHITDNK